MIAHAKLSFFLIAAMALLLLTFQGTGYADLDFVAANKPYQISFVDWVVVYLSTQIGASTKNYFVHVGSKAVNKKVRFVVQGYYADTVTGRDWYERLGSKIEDLIAKHCKIWTVEGHPISLNDFEVTIRKQ